jgi:hypothetical protein
MKRTMGWISALLCGGSSSERALLEAIVDQGMNHNETRVHHTDLDTYDHLRIEDLKQGAVVLASLLIAAADADKPLPRGPVPTQPKVTEPFAYPEPDRP